MIIILVQTPTPSLQSVKAVYKPAQRLERRNSTHCGSMLILSLVLTSFLLLSRPREFAGVQTLELVSEIG